MSPLPSAPDLMDTPNVWRDWIRKLDNEQLLDSRWKIITWEKSEHGIKLTALERIERMMMDDMVRRFAGIVERVAYLETALRAIAAQEHSAPERAGIIANAECDTPWIALSALGQWNSPQAEAWRP